MSIYMYTTPKNKVKIMVPPVVSIHGLPQPQTPKHEAPPVVVVGCFWQRLDVLFVDFYECRLGSETPARRSFEPLLPIHTKNINAMMLQMVENK
jgi:hypothetical protein